MIVLLLASLAIGGCQKKIADTIDGQTPDQRLAAAMTAYQQQLTQSPYGWILVEQTTGTALNQGSPTTGPAAAFAYYMQFNDSNQVTMFSDFDTTTTVARTSTYRLKALQRPALIFDTYSYIHLPCDPNPAVSKSPFGAGLGWGADFEFSFADNISASALGDTIHLLGNLNSATAMMVKATKAQHDAYFNGTFAKDFIFNNIQNYFKNMVAGGKTYQFTPGLSTRVIDISWLNGPGDLKTASTPFYQVADGIGFVTPVQANLQTLTGIQNIVWDPNTQTASAKINGASGTLAGAIAPLYYDPNSGIDWYLAAYNNAGLYISNNGFHIDGVDDAFRLDTLTFSGAPFFTWVYYPGIVPSPDSPFNVDLFVPFFNNGYPDYSPGIFPEDIQRRNNGVFYFFFDVLYATYFPPDPVINMIIQQQDPAGYYFILKEDGSSYDQVITSDAKAWVSWNLYTIISNNNTSHYEKIYLLSDSLTGSHHGSLRAKIL